MPVKFSTQGFATFDRNVVKTRWRKINETPIKRAGLLVRAIARRSIRVRKSDKPSPAGEPPRSRAPGKPLKLIFSVPDNYATQTIVGPLGFHKPGEPTPAVHEFGETAIRTVFVKADNQGRSTKGRFRKKRRVAKRKSIKYPKRAYMRPALKKARDKLPELWAGSLR